MLVSVIIVNSIFVTGCWNYMEVDKLAIVTGVAIDKGTNNQYIITVEIAQISGGKDTKTTSKVISMEGKTMFDAVRNGISLTGIRLYWSHSKVIVLSKEIASEGIMKVIDWYIRDAETREDANILISAGASAKEIFEEQGATDNIKSITLDEILENQKSLSKAPITDILQFGIESHTKGMSTAIPTVNLKQADGKMVPQIIGSAIIKNGKLVGFLNDEETKDLIFIRNEVKGGALVEGMQGNAMTPPVSLEIFKSKTELTPVVDGKNIGMNINIDTTVAIDEIGGTKNYIEDDKRMELEQNAESTLKKRIKILIKKIQSEYDADILGFGEKLHEDNAKAWNIVSDDWEDIFKDLRVNVKTRVHIKNSAIISEPIKEGD